MFDREDMEKLRKREMAWREKVDAYIKEHPEKKSKFETQAGIEVKSVYSPLDIQDGDYENNLGYPGEYPFTRGIDLNMYRSNLWVMGQYAGFGTAVQANQRYRYLLKEGQNGFGIAFDLPTQLGYDSDDYTARNDVGRVGVAVDTVEDMKDLLKEIPLNEVQIRVIANAPTVVILAMIVVSAKEMGFNLDELQLALQNDILKEYSARGLYIFPPAHAMKLFTDTLEYCTKYMPKTIPSYICGYHHREAGCNTIQEIAFTLSNAIAYAEAGIKRGLSIDDFGNNLMFYFSCHMNLFEEVAKLRAARRLWARIVRNRFNAKKDDSCMMKLYATSSGSTLTSQEPYNNIIRVAMQALTGVLGGAQVMHLASMDEGHALPTETSVKIAVRTQQLLAYEFGLTDTADPLGGSYYVEYLTDEIERLASEHIEKIDAMGGAVKAIEAGYYQREIARAAYEYQSKIDKGEQAVIGVNKYRSESKPPQDIFVSNPELLKTQIDRVKKVKANRDQRAVEEALNRLKEVLGTEENIMEYVIEAVKCRATGGEISGVLKEKYGEYQGIRAF